MEETKLSKEYKKGFILPYVFTSNKVNIHMGIPIRKALSIDYLCNNIHIEPYWFENGISKKGLLTFLCKLMCTKNKEKTYSKESDFRKLICQIHKKTVSRDL